MIIVTAPAGLKALESAYVAVGGVASGAVEAILGETARVAIVLRMKDTRFEIFGLWPLRRPRTLMGREETCVDRCNRSQSRAH